MLGIEPDGFGGWIWHHEVSPVIPQLSKAGVIPYLIVGEGTVVHERFISTMARVELVPYLEGKPEFTSGILHGLHVDVGPHRRDFRAYRGMLGPGSLQIVVDERSGNFYADVDLFNPYQDVVNWVGHAGEVIGALWRRIRP